MERGVLTDNIGGAADQRLRNTYSHRSQSAELASDSDDGALAREHLRVAAERRKASYDLKVKDFDLLQRCGTGTPENIPRNLQNGSRVTLVLTLSCVR